MELAIGPILPWEDRPHTPVEPAHTEGVVFTPVESAPNALTTVTPPLLFISTRLGGYFDMYVPFLATVVGVSNPSFAWSGATEAFEDQQRSFADLAFPENLFLPHRITVTVTPGGLQRSVDLASVTADPPLTAIGVKDQQIRFLFNGYTVQQGDTFRFEPNDIDVSNVTIDPGTNSIVGFIRPHNNSAPDHDPADAQRGPRDVIFTLGGQQAQPLPLVTVYQDGAAVQSLITLLDRPGPGEPRAPENQAEQGNGNRTQPQQDRINAVIAATAIDGANGASTRWNIWTNADASLTIPPAPLDQKQIDVLIGAGIRLEHPNGNQFKQIAASPDVPPEIWESFIRFLADEEGVDNPLAIHRDNVGVANPEYSTGLFQFLDDRARGPVFGYSNETWSITIDILDHGILEQWKVHVRDVQTLAALRALLANPGQIGDDWRSDPLTSIRNLTRHFHTYYGRLEGVGLAGGYNANTRFRVDLTPFTLPARPDFDPNAPSLGHGSQRDLYELFAVVHQSPGKVFGGGGLFGGLFRAAIPVPPGEQRDGWWALQAHPQHPVVMTQRGEQRAAAARQRYDQDF